MTPEAFKASRKELKLTQKQLAESLGMTLNMIQKLEKGDSPIRKVHEYAFRWVALKEHKKELSHEYQEDAFNE